MKSKFTYVGIRVTDMERSIDFYAKMLGMKVTGRGKIEQTKGEPVGLQSEKDGFILELNYYEKDPLQHQICRRRRVGPFGLQS